MSSAPSASIAPQPVDDRLTTFAGRSFCRFALENKIHCLPVDVDEELNYEKVDTVFTKLLGRAILPRIQLSEFEEPWVLDCGYGKGQWIDTLLDENPQDEPYTTPSGGAAIAHHRALTVACQVVGLDIYTGQSTQDDSDSDDEAEEADKPIFFIKKRWNLNASFRTSRDPDLRPESYNLINNRFLTDGIDKGRWDPYVRELKSLLEPGGWLQMVEVHMLFQSDSGRLGDDSCLHRWWQYYKWALDLMGKDAGIARQLGNKLREAGFERIHSIVHRLPMGDWMDNKEELGCKALVFVRDMIRSCSVWPFTQLCRLTPQQYQALITGAQRELGQPGLKIYLNVYVVYGRRPARES